MIIHDRDFLKNSKIHKKKVSIINREISKSLRHIKDYDQRIFFNLLYEDYEFFLYKIINLIDFIKLNSTNKKKIKIIIHNFSTFVILKKLFKKNKNIILINKSSRNFFFFKLFKDFLLIPLRFFLIKLFFYFFVKKSKLNNKQNLLIIHSPYTYGLKFNKLNEITNQINDKSLKKIYIPNFQNLIFSKNKISKLGNNFLYKEHFISFADIFSCVFKIFLFFYSKNLSHKNLYILDIIKYSLIYEKSLYLFYESFLNKKVFERLDNKYKNIKYFVTWWENQIQTKCIFHSISKNKSICKIAYLGYPVRASDFRIFLKQHDIFDNHLPDKLYFISDYFLKKFQDYSKYCSLKKITSKRYEYLKTFDHIEYKYILVSLPIFNDQSKLLIKAIKDLHFLYQYDLKDFVISLHPNLNISNLKRDLDILKLNCKIIKRNCFNEFLPFSKCVITSNSGTSLESIFSIQKLIVFSQNELISNSFIPSILPKKVYKIVNNSNDLNKYLKSLPLNNKKIDLTYYRKLILNI